MIATLLLQCGATSPYTAIDWSIAINVFINIGYWLLLVVVVYTLNIMLRQQLGQVPALLKIALLSIVGLMGVLTGVKIGLTSYVTWTQLNGYSSFGYRYGSFSYTAVQQFTTAYMSLYLVSVFAAGALALMSIMSLRSRRGPAGVSLVESLPTTNQLTVLQDLVGWVIALFLSMFFWVLIWVVSSKFEPTNYM
jgi:hypothetical protein